MKKLALIVAATALALAGFGPGASSARAQGTGPDAIDPIYALSLTEAINDHNPNLVREHFVQGGTVVFDNSLFGIPNMTMTAAEYATRQRPDQPDVPTDIHLEIVDRSLQIGATTATWTWRETAGYLTDIKVDYIEFNVSATTDNHRFRSLTVAPKADGLARLLSLAPTGESLSRLPYSPAVPTLPFTPEGGFGSGTGQGAAVVRFEPVGGSRAEGAAIVSAGGTGTQAGTTVSLHVTGLMPGTPAQASLHAGSCQAPSASVATLTELAVDASGTGTGTAPVLFRGTESVSLAAVADGEHIISISQAGQSAACGTIPALKGEAAGTVGMPRTGGEAGQVTLLLLVLVSAGLVLGGLRMRARTVL